MSPPSFQPSSPAPEPSLAQAPEAPPSVCVLGVDLALTDYAAAMDWMDGMIAAREQGYVAVAATHTVMASAEDRDLRAAIDGATLTVPDGQPLVWAMNALGHDLSSRVYGPELMDRACARAAELGHRIYLYGGRNEGALYQLTLNLRRRHHGLKIVGGHCPPFRPLSDDEKADIVTEINRSRADVVWVGIGVPKQEKWMAEMRPRLEAPVLVGVGAAFDFHAGLVPQAPAWMQDSGLEWAYRLAHEPRRLGRRYLRYNPRFVWGFARQYSRHVRDGRRAARSSAPQAPGR